uniref:Peptidase S1 domain-containing protein n=1 Tax=Timema bartmani TaxID=61472 RepID=A0A7R9F0F5_9NEOP|nr:unnamed protein product [Timema bartmani]
MLLVRFTNLTSYNAEASNPKTNNLTHESILGGSRSDLGEYPFMLALEDQTHQFCGASAIGKSWAITAAHCLIGFKESMKARDLELRAGSVIRHRGGSIHPVKYFIIHHNYDPETQDEDIALLKVVKKPFSDNPSVRYITLPKQNEAVKPNIKATVVGWGSTIMDQKSCRNTDAFSSSFAITKNMLCAASFLKDTRMGDSGGPMIVGRNSPKLVGITSWGEGTGDLQSPGVYTRVAKYRNWIRMKTGL